MNTDIRISISFRGHRKRKKLKMILGPGSTDYLLDLWIAVAMQRPDGVLVGWDETDIGIESGWESDPNRFVEALMSVGFLDRREDGVYVLHDWIDHNPYATGAKSRSSKGTFSNLKRWHPEIAAELESKGITAITKEEYKRLTSCRKPNPQPIGDRIGTESQTESVTDPYPNPPSPSPFPATLEEEDSLRSSSCAELLPDSTQEILHPLVCTLPLNDGTEFEVRADFVEQLQNLYRAVDVKEELRRMKGWLIGNAKNRKTKRGIRKFVTSWLDRAQNAARASPGSLPPTKQTEPRTYAQAQDAEKRATALRILERSRQHGNLADHRGHSGTALDTATQLPERT